MSEGNSRVPDLEPDAMSNNAGSSAGTAGCGCVLQPQTSSPTATSSQLTGATTSSDPTITISITPTTGGQFDITVDKNESIENLKKIISKRLKVAKERICLLHRERQLRDGTLEENRLQDGSRLTLLPSVETGLLAQRPEQSVMQALESLSDSQVNDFLSGKAPLNLTMRLGDHMMLIQLQLSTVTPANASTAAAPASLPQQQQQQQQQQSIQPVQQQQQQEIQQQQQPALDARRASGITSNASATTTSASKVSLSSSLVSKLAAASGLFGTPSPPNTPTSPAAPCCSQQQSVLPQPQQQQQNFVQPETPPVTPPGRQAVAQQQQRQPPKYRHVRPNRHAFYPYSLLDLNRQTRLATKAAATAAAAQAPKSCPSCPEASEVSPSSSSSSAPAATTAVAASQQQSNPTSPAELATSNCKFSDWSLILGPCDCSKLSPKNKVCATHANSSIPQEASCTTSGSAMEVCASAAAATTPSASATSTPTTPTTPVTPVTSPESPDTTSGDPAVNPTATLDTRALVEASRNLTQKLKQLSSEENAKRRQGAIIESMHHHGKGVYTGTFSGTLNPALQDRHGRPKRDISTIIHILNDLLCATPATTAGHYRYHRHPTTHHRASASSAASIGSAAATSTGATQAPSMFAVSSGAAAGTTTVGHAPAGLEATPGCPVSSTPGYSSELSKENEATKGKMRRLRLVMEQRREKMRARRQARAAPYTTKWAAVTPDPDPNASSSSSSSSSPGSGKSSSDSQNEPELKPCSPEPVVA